MITNLKTGKFKDVICKIFEKLYKCIVIGNNRMEYSVGKWDRLGQRREDWDRTDQNGMQHE